MGPSPIAALCITLRSWSPHSPRRPYALALDGLGRTATNGPGSFTPISRLELPIFSFLYLALSGPVLVHWLRFARLNRPHPMTAHTSSMTAREPRAAWDFTGHGTILLVEDEQSLRSLIARGLRSRGYSVIEAANGIEALEALERSAVDLVVSDVVMPEMDGPALLKAIRGRNPDLKILFVSGWAEDAFENSLPLNQPFLAKPFGLGQLVSAVKESMSSEALVVVVERAPMAITVGV